MTTVIQTTHKQGDWVCCWWCCHQFTSEVFSLPSKYDEKRDRYTLYGVFCSPNCGKAYMVRERNGDMGLQSHWLTRLLLKHYKHKGMVPAAPPRQALRMFGGSMSIEIFRSNHLQIKESRPPHEPGVLVLQETITGHKRKAADQHKPRNASQLRAEKLVYKQTSLRHFAQGSK